MHGDLRVKRMRQQAALRVIQRQAGFITGGFDAENDHGKNGRWQASCKAQVQSSILKELQRRIPLHTTMTELKQ
jgi:hypothetical protein